MKWLKRFFGGGNDEEKPMKDFHEERADLGDIDVEKRGVDTVPLEKIVGSVSRASELDENFRYKNRKKRHASGRFERVIEDMESGKDGDPIQVFKVKKGNKKSMYFVSDGHHRVAAAKQLKRDDIKADITEIVPKEDEEESNSAED